MKLIWKEINPYCDLSNQIYYDLVILSDIGTYLLIVTTQVDEYGESILCYRL